MLLFTFLYFDKGPANWVILARVARIDLEKPLFVLGGSGLYRCILLRGKISVQICDQYRSRRTVQYEMDLPFILGSYTLINDEMSSRRSLGEE